MEKYIVGLYKQLKSVVGFKVLCIDISSKHDCGYEKQVLDFRYSDVVNILKTNPNEFVNVKLENGGVVGINGSLLRYGIVNKSQALVIIRELTNNKGEFSGYLCSDSLGNMRFLTEQEAIGYAVNLGIANGKLVNSSNGRHISSIDGTYKKMVKPSKNEPSAGTKQGTNQNTASKTSTGMSANANVGTSVAAKPELPKELLDKIRFIKSDSRYGTSAVKKIVDSIEKSGKYTDDQKRNIDFVYRAWKLDSDRGKKAYNNIGNTSERKDTKPETYKDTTDAFEYREYKKNDGVVYLVGVKEGYKQFIAGNVRIPETVSVNGVEKRIVGIQAEALKGTGITNLYIGRNIIDIGQAAFCECRKLEFVDMHECQIRHIAMNMFNNCRSLKGIKLPSLVERIHEAAFFGCSDLREISIPDATDTIARVAFQDCLRLERVTGSITTINEAAFLHCMNLKDFDFSQVNTIGTQAFRGAGFETLHLPGNITSVGRKAFADCYRLADIELDEGIESLGEYCFAKALRKTEYGGEYKFVDIKPTERLKSCKSIKSIGADAFRNIKLVQVYTGSVSESQCIGFDIPYERLDNTNDDNSTRVRRVSEVMANNPIVMLGKMIKTPSEGASNPKVELRGDKLVNIPMSERNLNFMKIPKIESESIIEPHIKFTGFVNYLQDVSDLFKDPLSSGTIRLCDTFTVESYALYDDGYNRIYRTIYTLVDTLEQGGCIMVLRGNNLIYLAELTVATDVCIGEEKETSDCLPVEKFIHAGDKIGATSTISGHSGEIKDNETGKVDNIGLLFYNMIKRNAIEITPQRKDSIWFIPACNLALKLHDKREWEKYPYAPGGKRVTRESQDCLNVLEILSYDKLIEETKSFKKHSVDSRKFFKGLMSMKDNEVQNRIKFLSTVEEEKQAQLYGVSKAFIWMLDSKGIEHDKATPNDLTFDLLNKLSTSYWMISKDEGWIDNVGVKSLNKTNEYKIGPYKLQEFISNQVVKFSNPYMNGQKGAYVFRLIAESGMTVGVYASRHSMETIVKKLIDLTSTKPETMPMQLLTDANEIDVCDPDLFYNFYDVLYSKQGWQFKEYIMTYNGILGSMSADFHIAMYKPNGIFYLTMESYVPVSNTDKRRNHMVMPLIPIGNMDRALMIATTTNNKAKSSELLTELMSLAAIIIASKVNAKFTMRRKGVETNQYFKVREMIKNSVKDITQYKGVVNDRIVYMLGTVHTGELKIEGQDE